MGDRSIRYLTSGTEGSIYTIDNDDSSLIKRVFKEGSIRKKKIIPSIVSNLKLYNLVRIYEIKSYKLCTVTYEYYRDGLKVRNVKEFRNVVSYRMEKINPAKKEVNGHIEEKLILDFPLEYIIRNYYLCEDTIKELRENNLIVDDLHHGNFICTDERIVLIDVDRYTYIKPKLFFGKEKDYSNKIINANKLFEKMIHEHISLTHDDEIISLLEFYKFYNNPEYNFIDDIQKYDPNMTLRDYLKIKKKELNINFMKKLNFRKEKHES